MTAKDRVDKFLRELSDKDAFNITRKARFSENDLYEDIAKRTSCENNMYDNYYTCVQKLKYDIGFMADEYMDSRI